MQHKKSNIKKNYFKYFIRNIKTRIFCEKKNKAASEVCAKEKSGGIELDLLPIQINVAELLFLSR